MENDDSYAGVAKTVLTITVILGALILVSFYRWSISWEIDGPQWEKLGKWVDQGYLTDEEVKQALADDGKVNFEDFYHLEDRAEARRLDAFHRRFGE